MTTRHLKNYVLILTSFLSALPVRGQDPMKEAQDAVQASLQVARAKAAEAVAGDFNFAMTTVLHSLVHQPEVQALAASLLQQQKDLYNALKEVENLDAEQVAQVKAEALKAYEQYKNLSRQKADLSFQRAEARDQARESLRATVRILQQFANTCKTGRGIGGLDGIPFQYPKLPPSEFGLYLSTTSGHFYYFGTGSKAEKERTEAVNITSAVATNIVAGAYAGSGTSAAMCAVAAPWAIAGAVAVAVVVAYVNAEERVRFENEVVKAENYAFHETATDQAVGRFYREQCQEISAKTAPLIDIFMKAIEDPEELKKMAGTEDFAEEMRKLENLIREREALLAQLKELELKDDFESTQKKNDLIVQVTSLEKQLAAISTPEHIAQMAVQVLLSQQESFGAKFSSAALNSLDMAQRRAFDNILRILTLVQRQEFARFLSGGDEVVQELKAIKGFMSARRLFKEVVSMQIKAIFGKTSRADLEKTQFQLGQATRSLLTQYASSKEVANFSRQVHQLIGKY